MSRYAGFWSTRVRGCTIAEHAVLYRLGDRHNAETGRCYPGRLGLTFELECSKTYCTQVFGSIEHKKFMWRESRFDASGIQTTNEFHLNLDRWFPFHSEDVEREEKRLLGFFRRSVKDPEFAKGFHSVWLAKPYFPKSRAEKNSFRKNGRTGRKSARRPLGVALWIAVHSDNHQSFVVHHLPQLLEEIADDTGHKFRVEILRAYMKKQD